MDEFFYRLELKNNFIKRQMKNSAYSLRTYARDLQLSPSQLSSLFHGERHLSPVNFNKVATLLSWSPLMRLMGLEEICGKKVVKSEDLLQKIKNQEDFFFLFADWINVAILSIAEQEEKILYKAKVIAKLLGVLEEQVQNNLERLKRLQLITEIDGYLYPLSQNLATTEDIPSEAIRRFHRQIFELSIDHLWSVDVSARELNSYIFNFSFSDMEKAKEEIRLFKKKFAQKFEKNLGKDVYCLQVNFIPLTKREE